MIKINKDFFAGTLVGFGAGFAARSLQGNARLRDLTKEAMKWGMVSARGMQVKLAELKETIEDLTAEARSEVTKPESGETTAQTSAASAVPAAPEVQVNAPKTAKAKEKVHAA